MCVYARMHVGMYACTSVCILSKEVPKSNFRQYGQMKRRRKKIKKRKSPKKEDPGARKGRKVAKHFVFLVICGSGGSKSRLAKAAGAEPAGQVRDEELHAVVARSTFPSQKTKNTSRSEHFWKLRCLWLEAHFQVKMYQTPHVGTTFGS